MSGNNATVVAKLATNEAVRVAQDLPDLVQKLKVVDPTLAGTIEGKALLASKSPWGTLAAGVIGYLASRYGLGWNEATDSLVAGACVLLGSYAMRLVTSGAITGFWQKKPLTGDLSHG